MEDDENILTLLSAYLESAGYSVTTAIEGNDGLEKALNQSFDICVLDVMLPNKTGIEIAASLRETACNTPILFLTALGSESDVLEGFGAGADDYMIKPFSPRELLVRIAAILKRNIQQPEKNDDLLQYGPIQLDDTQALCRVHGHPIDLTPYEYRILRQLLKRPNRIFERRTLIATIYGNEDAVSPKAIDVHMHHLRTKLGEGVGEMIQTVRGFGYKFLLESRQA